MGAIASLDYTKEERQRLAKNSLDFECPECGKIACLLQEPNSLSPNENNAVQEEARALASQVTMKGEREQPASNDDTQNIEPVIPDVPLEAAAPVPAEQVIVRPERQSTNDGAYNYIIAAIIVALAILLFRRFALPAVA
jgi:hypothetical protein